MKHTSTKLLVFLLLVGVILSGYNYFYRPFLARFSQQKAVEEVAETADPLQVALAELTAEERVMQLIAMPVTLEGDDASASAQLTWIEVHQPGFITLFGSNLTLQQTATFSAQLAASANRYIPLLAVDHEGGVVQRLRGEGFTTLPSWRQSCQLATADRLTNFATSAGELRQAGIQLVFAPVLDIAGAGSFLGTRACLTEDEAVATAQDYITSFAQQGILPVAKHFPGIGSLTVDPHNQLATVVLQSQDTLAFDRVLQSFSNIGVMTAHTAVEGRTDGVPCSLSAFCLDRFPINFPEVILFTDALEMTAAGLEEGSEESKELSQIAIEAIAAGNDVLVFGETVTQDQLNEVVLALMEEYRANSLFRSSVDDSVMKVLSIKTPL